MPSATFGALRAARPAPRPPSAQGARLRLEAAGLPAATLGRHLAGRRDILPVALCRELGATHAETDGKDACGDFAALSGRWPEGWFLDPQPQSIRLGSQVHRGRTKDGQSLRLELSRPDDLEVLATERVARTVAEILVEILEESGPDISSKVLRRLVADASEELRVTLDMAHRSGALRAMTEVPGTVAKPEAMSSGQAPFPPQTLCWPDCGPELGQWWKARRESPQGFQRPGSQRPGSQRPGSRKPGSRRLVAVQVARLWLAQALYGPAVPAAPEWEHVVLCGERVFSERGLRWIGGATGEADPACQAALVQALAALRDEESETAASSFLELFEPHPETRRLAHALPMASSDEPPDPVGYGRRIEPLMLYWRLATEAGLQLRPTCRELLAGLARLDMLVGTIDDAGDAVATALDELSSEAERRAWGTVFDIGVWRRELEPFAATLSRLPEQIDRAVGRLADGDVRVRVEMPSPERQAVRGLERLPAFIGAVVLVLCGLELSSPWLTPVALICAGLLIGHAGRSVHGR